MGSRLFNGSNQYAQTSSFLSTVSRGCSIGGWFRTSTVAASAFQRVATWENLGGGNCLGSLLLNYPHAGDLANQNYRGGGGGNYFPSVSGLVANQWHYGLAVAGNGATTIYLDGKQGTSASVNSGLTCPYFIVGREISNVQFLPGATLEITVWDDVLDLVDARELFRGELPFNIRPDRLVASYYPATESRFRFTDCSAFGGNYDLTPTNAPLWADIPVQVQRRQSARRRVGSTVSTFTAAITGTMGAMTASLAASHTTPTYTAAIAATHAAMTAAVSASHSPPASTASVAATLAPMTATVSATFAKPTYTATISGTVAPMTASVAAQFSKPTYTAAVAGTMAPMVATVSATSADPAFTAAVTATMAPMTANTSAIFAKPVYIASVAATLAPMAAAVSATLVSPTDTATITAVMGAMTASLSAAFSEVFFVSPVSHLSESIARRLRTEASTGMLQSGSNSRRLMTEAVAADATTEAVARRLRTSNVN